MTVATVDTTQVETQSLLLFGFSLLSHAFVTLTGVPLWYLTLRTLYSRFSFFGNC
jgi:hypothetical protein